MSDCIQEDARKSYRTNPRPKYCGNCTFIRAPMYCTVGTQTVNYWVGICGKWTAYGKRKKA
jgi:hypothetical protein